MFNIVYICGLIKSATYFYNNNLSKATAAKDLTGISLSSNL